MNRQTGLLWQIFLGAVALMVLGFFLSSVEPVLRPPILFLVLFAVLTPFRRLPGHALLLTLMALLVLVYVLSTTGFLLAPFVLAAVLAYVLDPLVDVMEARGVQRSLAILVLALPALAILALIVVLGLPALGSQVAELILSAPELLDRLAASLERLAQGDDPGFIGELAVQIQALDSAAVIDYLQRQQAVIVTSAWEGVLGLGRGIGSVVSILGYAVLTPVITFYLLRDWNDLMQRVEDLIPAGRRGAVVGFFWEYDRLLSRYLRGQVTVALVVGTVTALGLWLVQFPYPFLIGAVVAVFNIVPYLGLVLSLVPALMIALVSGAILINLAKIALVYSIAQFLDGAVVSPRIVGESVGLHPVWVVLALSIAGVYFGFVGLLIGVPLAVGVKLLVLEAMGRYRRSRLYLGVEAGGPEGGQDGPPESGATG